MTVDNGARAARMGHGALEPERIKGGVMIQSICRYLASRDCVWQLCAAMISSFGKWVYFRMNQILRRCETAGIQKIYW